ncbi:Dolichyl-phosphate-mannose-protein mannosyltransferase [Nocardia amikacinitolerans]|uniref:Dolichyl-phosphate-mannose-protein mannosyltransferase n=1 Tax=Nocardia amikacinitolerans TaxID=756689 RepID=A0A285L3F9_9NOCA|nr:glycosyltransferase family 39 protein [Nocardia amikacinitolerans]SNY79470.1 Dolichyl-phosphate-mannose-protein mannosyltransferase [Nocardia amikacinitolerans]
MIETVERQQRNLAETDRPPVASTGIAVVAGISLAVLLFSASRYDYFGDELYFLAAGRHPSFGYADQGPVLPMLARLMDTLAPGSFFALRLPAVALTTLAVVLTALLAREFGGGRRAQLLAAIAYATSPFLLLQGKMLTTNAIDTVLWVIVTWLVVRWVRTRRDALLLCAALVTAVDMQVKWLIPLFWIAIAVTSLALGPRELVRRPLLWLGGAIVVLATVPTLIWQAGNGWPQLRMGEVISGEQGVLGGRLLFVPLALLTAGLLGAVVLVYGVWALLRNPALRPYRFLGATLLVLVAIFLVMGGRIYYMAGMYAVVLAAGAVGLVELTAGLRPSPRRLAAAGGAAVVLCSTALVLWSTPWQHPDHIAPPADDAEAAINIGVYGEFGWPELTAAVTEAYAALAPAERATTVVLTDTYWQASALDQFARDELPPIYSPSRGYGYFGRPDERTGTVLAVGVPESFLRWNFDSVEPVGKVDSRLGFPGNTQDVTVWACTGSRHPWAETWPDLMHL